MNPNLPYPDVGAISSHVCVHACVRVCVCVCAVPIDRAFSSEMSHQRGFACYSSSSPGPDRCGGMRNWPFCDFSAKAHMMNGKFSRVCIRVSKRRGDDDGDSLFFFCVVFSAALRGKSACAS